MPLPPIGISDTITTIEIDIDDDGTYDISKPYDTDYEGILAQAVDQLSLLGSPASRGDYTGATRLLWSDGTEDIYDLPITIVNSPPNITLSVAGSSAGQTITATVSYDDYAPGVVQSVTVDFNGQLHTLSTPDTTATHSFSRPGSYPITATATDDAGDSEEVTVWVDIDDAMSPLILASDFTLQSTDPLYGTLVITAADYTGIPFPSSSTEIIWDSNDDGTFDPLSDDVGDTVTLYADSLETYTALVQVTDPFNGAQTEAYFEFTADGMAVGETVGVDPQVSGKISAAPSTDLTVKNIVAMYKIMYPDKDSQILLKAFQKEGEIIVTDLSDFWGLLGLWDFDYWNGSDPMRIELDESLNVPMAAFHLKEALIKAAGTTEVRGHIVALIGDSGDVGALITSMQSGISQAASAAATIAESYLDGLLIFHSGADLVFSIAQGTDLYNEGRTGAALASIIPILGTAVKKGGKVIIKVGDKVKYLDAELVQWAYEYAELVVNNKFKKWADDMPDVPAGMQKKVRQLARELYPTIAIPIRKDIPGYIGKRIPDFDAVAYKIPGLSAPYMATLKKSLHKASDTRQFKYLNDLYFNGVQPPGYVWHHHRTAGKMQLVPESIHLTTQHWGPTAKGFWAYSPERAARRGN